MISSSLFETSPWRWKDMPQMDILGLPEKFISTRCTWFSDEGTKERDKLLWSRSHLHSWSIPYSLGICVLRNQNSTEELSPIPACAAAIVINLEFNWSLFEQKFPETAHLAKQAVLEWSGTSAEGMGWPGHSTSHRGTYLCCQPCWKRSSWWKIDGWIWTVILLQEWTCGSKRR